MKAQELTKILNMNMAQRIWLVQQIWDSIHENPEAVPVPEWQKEELDKRLDNYYKNPESGSSRQDVKERILADL